MATPLAHPAKSVRRIPRESDAGSASSLADFRQSNREWLEAYCLFMAIKSQFDSRSCRSGLLKQSAIPWRSADFQLIGFKNGACLARG